MEFPTGAYPVMIAAEDMDRDGLLDLITADAGGTVTVLRGEGGGFHGGLHYGVDGAPTGLGIGDLDGDGAPDVVVSAVRVSFCFNCEPGPVTVLRNTRTTVAARLASWSAERLASGVQLRWTSAGGPAGFHVFRGSVAADRVQVTSEWLAGGPEFEFLDAHVPAEAVSYWLWEVGRDGSTAWHGPLPVPASGPRLGIGPARPNPFASRTTLIYTLEAAGHASVSVVDVLGRRVAVLEDGWRGPGPHEVAWTGLAEDGARVRPGLYFLVLEAGGGRAARKVLLAPGISKN